MHDATAMQRRIGSRYKIICFSGIDGSGKSAHARRLFYELEAAGVKCKYKWLRSPHLLTFFPMAFYKLRDSKEKRDSTTSGRDGSVKSRIKANRFIATAWALIVFVDSFLSMVTNVYLPALFSYTLILDRFAIDTLLDVAISLKKEELIFSTTGRMFLNLVPRNSVVLIFDVGEALAASRRGTHEVENLSRRRALYRRLSQISHWNVISTEAPFPDVHDRVLELVSQVALK
jgi:thymidylate kinase